MAIDSAAKRNSAIATRRLPWFRRFAPIPDGSVGQGDRQQVALVYRGILVTVAVAVGVVCLHPSDAAVYGVTITDAAVWDVSPMDAALYSVDPTDESC